MTRHAHLASQNDVVPYLRRTCEPNLGAEQGIVAHRGAVPDLDQVIDLAAASDARFADACAVDAGVFLDIVADDHRSGLGNLLPGAIVTLGKAKSVPTMTAPFCNTPMAKPTALANHCVRVSKEIVADLHPGIDDNMRKQRSPVAQHNSRPDNNSTPMCAFFPIVALESMTAVG